MTTTTVAVAKARPTAAQVVVGLNGALFVLTGASLLLTPAWFFETIGRYPPFNRHYEGDLGAFILATGFGLLWAAQQPRRYQVMIAVAATASLFHTLNMKVPLRRAGMC